MRQIITDVETTGLDPNTGDKIVSLAAVELINQEPTGKFLSLYFNPGRPSSPGALVAHGLTEEFLADKPRFEQEAERVTKVLGSGQLIIHNAPFDLRFINAELRTACNPFQVHWGAATCTLEMAQRQFGRARGRNTLDALATRFGIPNLREKTGRHGALVDCLILVNIFRNLLGKPSVDLDLDHYLGKQNESQGTPRSQDIPQVPQADSAAVTGSAGAGGQ